MLRHVHNMNQSLVLTGNRSTQIFILAHTSICQNDAKGQRSEDFDTEIDMLLIHFQAHKLFLLPTCETSFR